MLDPLRPLAVPIDGVAELLSVSRRKAQQMDSSGALGPCPIRFGKSVRYSTEELEAWVRAGCPCREKWVALREASGK